MRKRATKGSATSSAGGEDRLDNAAADNAESFGPMPLDSRMVAFVVAGVAIAAYSAMLGNDFTHDDKKAIINNADLRPTSGFDVLVGHDYWGTPMDSSFSHKSYRPLAVATTKINYHMSELAPLPYMITDMALYGLVCYLFTAFCTDLFSSSSSGFVAGILFALHPVHTEAVCNTANNRGETLSGIFFLLSFSQYVAGHRSAQAAPAPSKGGKNKHGSGSPSMGWLGMSMLFGCLATISKETG
jgi:hypothetical protein